MGKSVKAGGKGARAADVEGARAADVEGDVGGDVGGLEERKVAILRRIAAIGEPSAKRRAVGERAGKLREEKKAAMREFDRKIGLCEDEGEACRAAEVRDQDELVALRAELREIEIELQGPEA